MTSGYLYLGYMTFKRISRTLEDLETAQNDVRSCISGWNSQYIRMVQ